MSWPRHTLFNVRCMRKPRSVLPIIPPSTLCESEVLHNYIASLTDIVTPTKIPVEQDGMSSLPLSTARHPAITANHGAILDSDEGMAINATDDNHGTKPTEPKPSQYYVGKKDVHLAGQPPEGVRGDSGEGSEDKLKEDGLEESMPDLAPGHRKRPSATPGRSKRPAKRTKRQSSPPVQTGTHWPPALVRSSHKDCGPAGQSTPQEPARRIDGIPENRRSVRIEARAIHAREMQANSRAHGEDGRPQGMRLRSRAQLRPATSYPASATGGTAGR
ncbi:hypothetical protein C8Q73DRAFT_691966 [Cubamyces lactineus]|nr:hypothetical protein C8Q73DRAFT_691966 [Cubamyces lactineus]